MWDSDIISNISPRKQQTCQAGESIAAVQLFENIKDNFASNFESIDWLNGKELGWLEWILMVYDMKRKGLCVALKLGCKEGIF